MRTMTSHAAILVTGLLLTSCIQSDNRSQAWPQDDLGIIANVIIQQYKEPVPINAHLSSIHVSDNLQNTLVKINQKGTSCKFGFLARRTDGEYLVLESYVIKAGDESKSSPGICAVDFVFRYSSLIGITTFEQVKSLWQDDSPAGMIDAFIRSATINGMNNSSFSYDPDTKPTPDPGLTAAAILLYPISVLHEPVRSFSLNKILLVHNLNDVKVIDPNAALNLVVPHNEKLCVSEIYSKSQSHIYFLTSRESGRVEMIFGPDWWEMPK